MRDDSSASTSADDRPACVRAGEARKRVERLCRWFLVCVGLVVAIQIAAIAVLLARSQPAIYVPDSRLVRPIEVP